MSGLSAAAVKATNNRSGRKGKRRRFIKCRLRPSLRRNCKSLHYATRARDLLFFPSFNNSNQGDPSPFVIPTGAQRSGGICSAPCGSLKSFLRSDPEEPAPRNQDLSQPAPALSNEINPTDLLLVRVKEKCSGLIQRGDGSSGSLPRKDLREPQGALQIPPLRCASLGMTKGEGSPWLELLGMGRPAGKRV